jgi:hypothetical protein
MNRIERQNDDVDENPNEFNQLNDNVDENPDEFNQLNDNVKEAYKLLIGTRPKVKKIRSKYNPNVKIDPR